MTTRRFKLLCTGDVHLGRYPSRVPTGRESLSVREVWSNVVDRALEHEVDLVALTGDVIDRKNRYYEALGPFQRGIRRLGQAGVMTTAVSGNHDFDVLADAADVGDGDHFALLGRGGRWETRVLDGDFGSVRLVGWSYPRRHVVESPLSTLELDDDFRGVNIGLLHADLDAPASRYAPVTPPQLAAHPVAVWLLGHIHRAHSIEVSDGTRALYPGPPQPLEPGQQGMAGPWMVEVGGETAPSMRQLSTATVLYRPLDVDLEGVDEKAKLRRLVPRAILADLREVTETLPTVETVVYRLRYTGRSALHRQLRNLSHDLVADFEERYDDVFARVDDVEVATTPPVDLEALAQGQDPTSVLADLVLRLRDDPSDGELCELLDRMATQIDDVCEANAYRPLLRDDQTAKRPDRDWIRRQTVAQAMRLLDALCDQKRKGAK